MQMVNHTYFPCHFLPQVGIVSFKLLHVIAIIELCRKEDVSDKHALLSCWYPQFNNEGSTGIKADKNYTQFWNWAINPRFTSVHINHMQLIIYLILII